MSSPSDTAEPQPEESTANANYAGGEELTAEIARYRIEASAMFSTFMTVQVKVMEKESEFWHLAFCSLPKLQ
jgi:hypothetical protein